MNGYRKKTINALKRSTGKGFNNCSEEIENCKNRRMNFISEVPRLDEWLQNIALKTKPVVMPEPSTKQNLFFAKGKAFLVNEQRSLFITFCGTGISSLSVILLMKSPLANSF
jgi:hypothetical protein